MEYEEHTGVQVWLREGQEHDDTHLYTLAWALKEPDAFTP